jgi:transposase
MEEHRTRKKYDRQFKLDAVRMITEGGKSTASVARDLGIAATQLQRWKKEFSEKPEHAFPGKGRASTENKELEDLRKELARVKEEREILKKVVGVFSKRPG